MYHLKTPNRLKSTLGQSSDLKRTFTTTSISVPLNRCSFCRAHRIQHKSSEWAPDKTPHFTSHWTGSFTQPPPAHLSPRRRFMKWSLAFCSPVPVSRRDTCGRLPVIAVRLNLFCVTLWISSQRSGVSAQFCARVHRGSVCSCCNSPPSSSCPCE